MRERSSSVTSPCSVFVCSIPNRRSCHSLSPLCTMSIPCSRSPVRSERAQRQPGSRNKLNAAFGRGGGSCGSSGRLHSQSRIARRHGRRRKAGMLIECFPTLHSGHRAVAQRLDAVFEKECGFHGTAASSQWDLHRPPQPARYDTVILRSSDSYHGEIALSHMCKQIPS